MSSHSQHTGKPNGEHGTIQSYLIGFILSLVFTFIPYYLVVNQTFTGTTLLTIILGFAFVQMIIQITFFLHIGRGPKPRWNLFFFLATVVIIAVVVGGSVFIMNNLHYNMSPSDKIKKLVNDEGIYQVGGETTGACREINTNHKITIKDGQVSPAYTTTNKCDTLTFINEDTVEREITFGPHPEHGAYAGEVELVIREGRSKTLTLSEIGTYQFHDHFQPETAGQFTVNMPENESDSQTN